MTQYINKNALVAEIESKYQKYWKKGEESDTLQDGNAKYWGGVLSCLNEVKTLIDTLEVKEVDLEEAARKYEDKVYLEKGWQDEYGTPHAPFSEIGNAFREGGKFILKAQKGE